VNACAHINVVHKDPVLGWLCADCLDRLTQPSHVSPLRNVPRQPLVAGSPQPSTLDPLFTPEVEWLLSEADARRIDVALAPLPPLPDGATSAMRRVAEFYALVLALRRWAGDDRPVPFASTWVAAKLELP
jgi:hypothetical protein